MAMKGSVRLIKVKQKMLRIYVNEDSRYKRKSLYNLIVTTFMDLGLRGVTVLRGIEGYGKSKKFHTFKILDLSYSLPIIIEAIDTEENIDKAISVIQEINKDGIMITMDVDVILEMK